MMKNKTILNAITAFFVLAATSPYFSDNRASSSEMGYYKYSNEQFNYTVVIPAYWEMNDLNMEKKHVMLATGKNGTEIKVRAYKTDSPDIAKAASRNSWNLRKIDPMLNRIIETRDTTIRRKTGRLLVFEYRSARGRMLQRTMITKNDDLVYIIECKSPTRFFYRNENIFNVALSSFSFINPSAQEAPAAENDEGGTELKSEAPAESNGKKAKSGKEENFFDLD